MHQCDDGGDKLVGDLAPRELILPIGIPVEVGELPAEIQERGAVAGLREGAFDLLETLGEHGVASEATGVSAKPPTRDAVADR